ncbi:hypothetical protein [Anditalea andensis]|uniref:hypothetical protein n=1 Tax=Anditalea andensis TaxID=1048983 RepID=UPI0013DFF36E|nr:hypothetical protein [Anditalea andensis]
MGKNFARFQLGFFIWSCAFLITIPLSTYGNQGVREISLRNEKLLFTPTEFYFSEVLDAREEQSNIGRLLLPEFTAPQPVDLKGGGKLSISAFIFESVKQDQKLRPIQIHINEFSLSEKRGTTGLVEGNVKLHLSFYYLGEEDPVYLIDYNGGVSYRRSASRYDLVEPALTKSLTAALHYFQDWIQVEVKDNVKLARGIKVNFLDHNNFYDLDTVFYTADRPLVFDDFRAKPTPSSRFAASIFSSFSFDVKGELVGDTLEVNIIPKVYMLRDQSWARSTALNDYTLNHEQRHFDITQIIAKKLINDISNLAIFPDEYDSVINFYYLEAFREMNKLQDLYDKETRHGIDQSAQIRWNKIIDKGLQTGVLFPD